MHYKEQEGFINIKFWFNPTHSKSINEKDNSITVGGSYGLCAGMRWNESGIELRLNHQLWNKEKHTVDRPLSGTNKEEK